MIRDNLSRRVWNDKERSILILETTGKNLELTVKFLRQRNWEVRSFTGTLHEGLKHASACHPNYIFINAELIPSEGTSELLSAVKETYHAFVFSEQTNAHSLRVTQLVNSRQVVIASLTGPAIERAISLYHELPLPPLAPLPVVRKHTEGDIKVEIEHMAKACDHALLNACHSGGARKAQIVSVSKVYCLPVHSLSMSGYLVIAMADDAEISFARKLKEQLAAFMMQTNPGFRMGDLQTLELRELRIENLSHSYAEFLKKAWHLGQEVAIAFFKLPANENLTRSGIQEGWVSTKLSSLTTAAPITFDMYVYLSANKKFICYRKAGHVLEDRELQKLQSSGVSQVHLREDALNSYEKYVATNYINSLAGQLSAN